VGLPKYSADEVTTLVGPTDGFCGRWQELYPRVSDFLYGTADLLECYGIKLRVKLEPMHAFGDNGSSSSSSEDDGEGLMSGDLDPEVSGPTGDAPGTDRHEVRHAAKAGG
jgi:hypothetical protein